MLAITALAVMVPMLGMASSLRLASLLRCYA
jgi:hypothetical protein